ncbi:MAG: hypothetical protein R6V58_04355 [Planctomycetota bacterium]
MTNRRRSRCLFLAAVLALSLPAIAAGPRPVKVPDDAETVLNEKGCWRWYEVSKTPTVSAKMLRSAGREATGPKKLPGLYVDGNPPPAEWTQPDFDDSRWPRARGVEFPDLVFRKLRLGAVCMRAKFQCADLSRVMFKPDLYVSGTFRGGLVVYLNGREVARAGMPEAEIDPLIPASPYPDDLFETEDGKAYVFPRRRNPKDKELMRRIKGRNRTLGPFKVPRHALRTGVNVLALELHRSRLHWTALGWSGKNERARWVPCALLDFRLAVRGKGLTPNYERPKRKQVWQPDGRGRMTVGGPQVWTVDRNVRLSIYDYGDPCEPIHPVRLVGVRNGVFSGQVAVGSDRPIKDLKATASELRQVDGDAVIPADRVAVRYPRLADMGYRQDHWFDPIAADPPDVVQVRKRAGGATQPALITVAVPADAAPGVYRGRLEVHTDELEETVPIHLSVADWTLPEPHQYRAYAGIYQSPQTLSMKYDVPMWSDEHWARIERSFELLAYVGGDFVHMPIINRAQCGNDEGWVYWIEKPGGGYRYDFSVFDRYATLVKTYLVDPDFICLHVFRSRIYTHLSVKAMKEPHHVTRLDPKTGEKTPLRVPEYGTTESREFWKPVMLEAKRHLAKLGLADAIALGVLIEGRLPPSLTEFQQILPGVGWVKGCHRPTTATEPIRMKGGSTVVLQEHAYDVHRVNPLEKIPEIWRPRIGAWFARTNAERRDLQDFRILAERNLYFRGRGFGRLALDYWPVKAGRGRGHSIYQRWPESSSAQRGVYVLRLAWPGPNGAEPTLRLEALREGLQESEAAIFVTEALHRHADKLGEELAGRCRRIMVRRVQYCVDHKHNIWNLTFLHVNHQGWRALNRELFACAAEVARALGRAKD